ncbi:MAG: TetR/AcrR family transcriptional regulator [Pseudomonadota bacterium]
MGETESREKIIVAAVKLASGKRLDQIGADALAQHSGVSADEVRRIFPDCRALSSGIFQWTAHNLMAQIEHAALRNKPPLEALEDIFHLHVVFLVSHAALPPLLLEALAIPEDGKALRQRIHDLLADYEANLALLLCLARKDAAVRAELDPALAAKLFTYLTQGLAMRAITGKTSDVLLQEGRKVWQQYLNGIRA